MMHAQPNRQPAEKHYEYRSLIPASLAAVRDFHNKPEALPQLTPFPIRVQVIRDDRESLTEGELEFRLWLGPIPIRWLARHEPIENDPEAFGDTMLEGPMAVWKHKHLFREGQNGVELIDRVTLAHKAGWRGWLTRLLFDGLPLRFLFFYRHWRTKRATARG